MTKARLCSSVQRQAKVHGFTARSESTALVTEVPWHLTRAVANAVNLIWQRLTCALHFLLQFGCAQVVRCPSYSMCCSSSCYELLWVV
jgi:hypothetical protein